MSVGSPGSIPSNAPNQVPAQPQETSGTLRWLAGKALSGTVYATTTALWAIAHPVVATQSSYNYLVGKKIEPLAIQTNDSDSPVFDSPAIAPIAPDISSQQLVQEEQIHEHLPLETPSLQSNQEVIPQEAERIEETNTTKESSSPGIVKRTYDLAKTIVGLPFQSVSVFGYNVNPVSQLTNAVTRRLYPEPPEVADDELVAKLQDLKVKNRSLIPEVLAPISIETARIEENINIRNKAEEAKKLKEAKASFNEQKTILTENIADFTAITLVESLFIKANRGSDPLSFFLACKAQKDPLQGYFDLLWKESFVSWAIARISMPFITGVINPILKSGMNKLINDIHKHFASPQNSRKEIIHFFKVANDYFTSLKRINSAYAELKPGDDDFVLTREAYIKKHLKNYDTESLMKSFNTFLSNEFSLVKMDAASKQSMPWFIPSFLYNKIDTIIFDSINGLDLMQSVIDNVIGTKAQNTNLTFTISTSLRDSFAKAKEALSKPQDLSLQVESDQLQPSRVSAPQPKDFLDEDEKKVVGNFLNTFLDFLPLEGISDSSLKEALDAGIVKALEGGILEKSVSSKLKDIILDSLLDLAGNLFEHLNKDSSGYSLFSDQLQNVNQLFSPKTLSTPIHTQRECDQIIQEAKTLLQDVIDITVEDAFKVSPLEKAALTIEEQTKTILYNHAQTTNNFSQLIDTFHSHKKMINDSSDLVFIEDKVDQLLLNIDDLTNVILEDLNDALKFTSLNAELRKKIKQATSMQIENLSKIVTELGEIKKNIQFIRENQEVTSNVENLLPKSIQLSLDTTVAGITEKDFEAQLRKIDFKEFNDEGQQLLLDIEADRASLSTINHEMRHRQQLQNYLLDVNKTLKEIAFFNAQILARPQEREISELKTQLADIEKLIGNTAKLESKQAISENLDRSSKLIGQLKKAIHNFSNKLSPDEQKSYEDAINKLEEIQLSMQSLLAQENSKNSTLDTIQKSFADLWKKNYRLFNIAKTKLTNALDASPRNNSSDQTEITTRLANLNHLQSKNNQLSFLDNLEETKDITASFKYVQNQVLLLSVANTSTDKDSRNTLEIENMIEQIENNTQENLEHFNQKIKIKAQKEEGVKEKLDRLITLKREDGNYSRGLINRSFDAIQELGVKNKEEESKIKLDQGIEFYLGLGAPATYLGKKEVKKLLQPLPSSVVDFAVNPLHREELFLRGILPQIAKIKTN